MPSRAARASPPAFEGHVAKASGIDVCGLGGEGCLHPVLAADAAAGTEGDLGRIFLQRGHQLFQVLPGSIGLDHDGTVVDAERADPAHFAGVILAKLAQRQVDGGACAGSDDQVGVIGTHAVDVVVGYRADAAGHVGHQHRVFDQPRLEQAIGGQTAGQIVAAAGLGRSDALGVVGRLGRAGRQAGTQQQCSKACGKGYGSLHAYS